MPPPAECAPPRLVRAVLLQVLLLGSAAVLAEQPWAQRAPLPVPPPPKQLEPRKPVEQRLRVVVLPREPPPPPKLPQPQPAPAPAPAPAPRVAQAAPPRPANLLPLKEPQPPQKESPAPPPPKLALPTPPRPAEPEAVKPAPKLVAIAPVPAPVKEVKAVIAADSTSVHGVRLRVLVPRSPGELAAHLRNSGACLVVSRLDGESAEVLSVLALSGERAVEVDAPPCNGIPRLLRDAALNAALGDPLGRVRASHPGEALALQVLLTPRLPGLAQAALGARFGPGTQEELAQRAAAEGYELTCFAEPEGSVRCQ